MRYLRTKLLTNDTFSEYTAAIVLGITSEKTSTKIVRIITAPVSHQPPNLCPNIVAIDAARLFAKRLPIKIRLKSLSGLFISFSARFACLLPLFARWRNLYLFTDINPVSEPEKKAEINIKIIKLIIKTIEPISSKKYPSFNYGEKSKYKSLRLYLIY